MSFLKKILAYKLGLKSNNEYSTQDGLISYINWWNVNNPEQFWFTSFVRENIDVRRKINFYSVFGSPVYIKRRVKKESNAVNIFFTGENVSSSAINKNLHGFEDYLSSCVDVSMGFDYIENNPKYLRFPLWLIYLFSPVSTYEGVKKVVDDINKKDSSYDKRYIDCSVISRHDANGNRALICDSLSRLFNIKYEGDWRNNSRLLKDKYKDEKIEYLSHVKFNICPENSNHPGYVTEKLFEAFLARAIPIYWGGSASPELDILNESSFIYWDGSSHCYETVERLYKNKKDYIEFISQPVFKDGAEEIIWKYFQDLKNRIVALQEK